MALKPRLSLKAEMLKPSYYIGIFLIALSTLLLEFTLTRILSVALWYHFAFMIISVALLGFGVSGVVLALSKKLRSVPSDKLLTVLSMAYGISIVVCFIIMNSIPFDPFSLLTDTIQFLYLPVYYFLIALPFFFAGLIISIILTRFKQDVSKLYFFDLIGAGVACFIFVLLMPSFGGNGTIMFIASIAFIAAILFGYESHKTLAVVSFVLIGITMSLLIDIDKRLPINSSPNKIYGNYIEQRPDLKVDTRWNTFSKVDVMKDEQPSQDGYEVLLAVIDNGNATTNIPKVTVLPPPNKPADASNLAFAPFMFGDTIQKVFIIGSAGGGEVLTSLYHNAQDIVGVEINGALNDIIKRDLVYWTGPLINNNNKVKIITDDARSVISSKRIAYDVIISAHTISSSAVSSGAMSMVENYILTEEAVAEYIDHLSNDGVIYISRPETQIPKLLTTFKKARFETSKGLEKSKNHFVVFRRPPSEFEGSHSFMAGVLYKKNGFSEEDIIRLKNEAAFLSLNIEYDPTSKQEGIYKDIVEADNLDGVISNSKTDITPATDDKPFFDNNIGFKNLTLQGMRETFAQDDKAILALKDRPVAETTLIIILIQSLIAAGLLILLPLKFLKKDNDDKKDKGKKFNKKFLIYFGCLGAGYIMLQICMIQKFTLFLGQPVYTLLTVVSTMLVASGLGSMFSLKFLNNSIKKLYIIFGIIALLAIAIGIFNPALFQAFSRLDLMWRIVVSAVIIFPLGFFMGMPFPIGLTFIEEDQKRYAAFAWGVNGFFSVIGTVLAMMFAMILGFKIVFIISALIYICALFCIIVRFKELETVKA